MIQMMKSRKNSTLYYTETGKPLGTAEIRKPLGGERMSKERKQKLDSPYLYANDNSYDPQQ